MHGGQVACEPHVPKCRDNDERGSHEREDHPRAEKSVARAGFAFLSLCDAPFTSRAEDGDDGGHGGIVRDEG